MEDTKYYTPTIEEFHVGFKYEMKETFGDGTMKTQEQFDKYSWEKYTALDINDLAYVNRTLRGRNATERNLQGIRVKYLDKEDIESLFNPLDILDFKETDTKSLLFDILGNDKRHNTRTVFCFVYTRVNWLLIYNKKTEEVRFAGGIRNKSELKVLLKQLQIV